MPVTLPARFANKEWNTCIAKAGAKPKWSIGKAVIITDSQEVLCQLSELGVNVTERTLQLYVKRELMPKPTRKSLGRGKGKITDYPEEAVAEFYASWRLIHHKKSKLTPEMVAEIRSDAHKGSQAVTNYSGQLDTEKLNYLIFSLHKMEWSAICLLVMLKIPNKRIHISSQEEDDRFKSILKDNPDDYKETAIIVLKARSFCIKVWDAAKSEWIAVYTE